VSTAAEHADVESSSDAYARRFDGAVGAWFLDVQARITLALVPEGASVLDVGGGHGQLAGPLAEAGHAVTVLASDPGCVHRVRALVEAGRVRFESGDLLALPFPDRAFDVALAFRLLPHVAEWRRLVGELCRVARRAVIVDYPTTRSVNAVSGALFGAKKGVEGDTRPFAVFSDDDVRAAFADHGFDAAARRPQFLLPMALHRALGTAGLSQGAEAIAAAAGLTSLFGSPVILKAERRG
jgi:2-polyprenyl-3-methyl-5-hydroxy-6-metoxy-1,4-benzoquinol methylase